MPTTVTSPDASLADAPLRLEDDAQRRVLHRLRRLEGQVRGLQHMIEDGRSCREVLTLLAGVRSALNATGDVILERYVESCTVDLQRGDASVRELVDVVKLSRG
jgi:CsoR family transcriptional regulator, copper-sensing transcriptional repressor